MMKKETIINETWTMQLNSLGETEEMTFEVKGDKYKFTGDTCAAYSPRFQSIKSSGKGNFVLIHGQRFYFCQRVISPDPERGTQIHQEATTAHQAEDKKQSNQAQIDKEIAAAIEYNAIKKALGLNEDKIAKMFGYKNAVSLANAARRDQIRAGVVEIFKAVHRSQVKQF